MSSPIKISQLASVAQATNDDVFIINDAGANTRKITYANLIKDLVVKGTGTDQEIAGNLTVGGTLTVNSLNTDSDLINIDGTNRVIGINTADPQHALDVTGDVRIRDGFELQLGDTDNDFYIGISAPDVLAENQEYKLPGAPPPRDNMVLSSDRNGNWNWVNDLIDPTTAVGDLIFRNLLDSLDRLPIGSTGQHLEVRADGTPAWLDPEPSFGNPMTAAGDMIIRTATQSAERLPIGTENQFLQVNAAGLPEWRTVTIASPGNNTEVLFNALGVVSGNANFTYNAPGSELQVANLRASTSINSLGPVTIGAYTLPIVDGNPGDVLKTDGNGNLSWQAP